jgi:hypothetical protein
MKKISLCLLLLAAYPALSQAKDKNPPQPRTAYLFDLSEFKSPVKELKISFANPEATNMSAQTEAKLADGKSLSGEFSCTWTSDHKTIQCSRDDDGGSFSFLAKGDDYKLSFERFDLNDEGDEAEVAIVSRTPAQADEVMGKKVDK